MGRGKKTGQTDRARQLAMETLKDQLIAARQQLEQEKQSVPLNVLEDLQTLEKEQHLIKEERQQLAVKWDQLEQLARNAPAQWVWLDDKGDKHAFDVSALPILEDAIRDNNQTVSLKSGCYEYEVDLISFTQRNVSTNKTRKIERHASDHCQNRDTDPVKHILLTLQARSQEIEALKKERNDATTAQKASEQAWKERDAAQKALRNNCKRHDDELNNARSQADDEKRLREKLQKHVQDLQKEFSSQEKAKCAAEEALKKQNEELKHYKSLAKKFETEQNDLKAKVTKLSGELKEAKESHDGLQGANGGLAREVDDLRQGLRVMETKLEDMKSARDAESSSHKKCILMWKSPHRPFAVHLHSESSTTLLLASQLLKKLSHQDVFHDGQPSRCYAFQKMVLKSVQSVHNPALWAKYCLAKDDIKKRHAALGITLAAFTPAFNGLDPLLGECNIDGSVNEVILAHGCSEKAANAILKEGFDIRHTGTSGGAMYGEGIYFAKQPCKTSQYSKESANSRLRHLIIARVALGDPNIVRQSYTGRLAPHRDSKDESKGRFDSNYVDPLLSVQNQAHAEFVIFSGEQAYPELYLTYELPP